MERPQAKREEEGDKAAEVCFVTGRKRNQVGAEGKGAGDIQNNGSPPLPSTATPLALLPPWVMLGEGENLSRTVAITPVVVVLVRGREGGSPPPWPSLSLSFPEAHLPPLSSSLQPTLSSPPPSWHIVARSSSLPSLLIDACFLCVKARAKVDEEGVFPPS